MGHPKALMLVCPVRGCHLALAHMDRRMVCPRGHSFDIARSGYINLLQPQDKRSKNPGDSAEAVAARRRIHDRGITQPLLNAIAIHANASREDVVLDAGCGDGYYLGNLAARHGFFGHGIDISIPAIEAAAKRYPGCQWIVANADREIPFADGWFSLVLSITARMNPVEFRRVLRNSGRLLIALPAPGDLIELRGEGREDRVARTVEAFAPHFALIEKLRVTTTSVIDAAAVEDILLSIYRPLGMRPVEDLRVTFSLDLLLFQPSDISNP